MPTPLELGGRRAQAAGVPSPPNPTPCGVVDDPPATVDTDGVGTAARPAGAARVLVVEDDAVAVDLLRVLLGAEGYDVVHVEDLASFRRAVLDGGIVLVLLDVRLRGASGLDLLAEIGDLDAPVIGLTAHPESVPMVDGRVAGLAALMAKPVEPVVLLARIRRVLGAA